MQPCMHMCMYICDVYMDGWMYACMHYVCLICVWMIMYA